MISLTFLKRPDTAGAPFRRTRTGKRIKAIRGAIERLAAAGRLADWPTDEGRILAHLVSDAQVEMAARLRQARAILSLFGGLGRAHKMAVRETAG